MEYNFSFLHKHKLYESFSNACIEAEKSLVVSYATTGILTRRALELAVKWVFSFDEDLKVPYQEGLAALIHDYSFRTVIDCNLFPKLKYIQQLGNKSAHTNNIVTREQAVLALRNLFEFISWIDYCYSDQLNVIKFDETILLESQDKHKTRKEREDLYEHLASKDKKIEEIIKENEELRKNITAKRIKNEKERDFKVEEISEYKTRKIYIDMELELRGWTIGSNNCQEEVPVDGMRNSSGEGFIDYVLYGDDGKALAVIEAKRTSKDPREGKQQAKLYADCLEKEHRIRPIIFYTNGFEYYLWDDCNYPERKVSGIYTKKELEWMMYKRNNKELLDEIYIKDHITNRPYQKMAIRAVCDTLEKNNRKSLLVMATGSGKTRVSVSTVDVLRSKGWVKNILFLADRTALVKQAKRNFKELLPDLSLCNLLDSKDSPESRMIFSTYPTMMNAIDEVKNKDGKQIFGVGHFDLIIIDESHRSIYKKYKAIFEYFDAILLGLTATPKDEVDKNTYEIFELENNVPTYAYELWEAIEDKFLVPHHSVETKMKFIEEGIRYDELSEEEKEEFEDTFEDGVTEVSGEALNSFLFNNNTIDTVIIDLMNDGIKVEGGDKIGKTIIFAKNKKHADFILKRFDILFPEFKSSFARCVYTGINYVDTVIDDFSTKERLPQIAISVDMLDTGIDIPEIVNLVFFKKIRSKTKFWQMIGRGTRLCEDLFGPGIHKDGFRIFDYCSNFEYFRMEKKIKESKTGKSLTENLFNIKCEIIKELQNLDYQDDEHIKHRKSLVDEQVKSIQEIDQSKFDARMKIQHIHRYNKLQAWESIKDVDISSLKEHISPLILAIEDEELAKRFDLLMLTIEYSDLKGMVASKPKMKVVSIADRLSTEKGNMDAVKRHKDLILKVQTDEFWEEADIFEYEEVRIAIRDLMGLLEYQARKDLYTNFIDEVMEVKVYEGEFAVNDLNSYRKKVNQYLKEHKDDIVVFKLRNNKPICKDDIKHLEKILWSDLGTKDDYTKEFGQEPLEKLVAKIVGLEPAVAKEAFSEFLSDETLNIDQMEFVKMIVDFIIANGSIEKAILNEQPFNKFGNVLNLFEGKKDIIVSIIKNIDELNSRIEIS